MAHIWTDFEDERLKFWLNQGLLYGAVADKLTEEDIPATRDSVKNRAVRLGVNVGSGVDKNDYHPIVLPSNTGAHFERLQLPVRDGDRFVVMNDIHFPFQDDATLECLDSFLDDLDPSIIILNGDINDFYEVSRFDKNPRRSFSLQDELDMSTRFKERLAKRYPTAHRVLIDGNHEDRLRQWLWAHPQIASLRALNLDDLLSAGDAFKRLSYGSQVQISHLLIEHGQLARQGSAMSARAMYAKRGMSGIMGHTHRFGTISRRDMRGQHIYIENGCLCGLDPEYEPCPDWTQGFTYGFIRNGSVHVNPTRILEDGFYAGTRRYKRRH
jgi:UDP-2,3-diacylglucosamine pyrophosphatase LpxH